MNFVFWFLLILALVFIWVCLCSVFKPLGRIFYHLFHDVKDTITEDDAKLNKDQKQNKEDQEV